MPTLSQVKREAHQSISPSGASHGHSETFQQHRNPSDARPAQPRSDEPARGDGAIDRPAPMANSQETEGGNDNDETDETPSHEERARTATETEAIDPDELRAKARVMVLGKRGEISRATIRRRHARKGAPDFMVHYDGKKVRGRLDWFPQASVANCIKARKAKEATEKGRGNGTKTTLIGRGDSIDARPAIEDERWERNYRELAKFSDEEGHCNVPGNQQFKTLSTWVQHQRQAYKANGGTLRLNRAVRLERIGFTWNGGQEEERKEKATTLGRGGSNDATQWINDERWERKYQELVKFRDEAGHCQVARSHNCKTLCSWVDHQRQAYKINGGTLRGNRAARLESLEFVWRVEKGNEGEKEEEGQEKATKLVRGFSNDAELPTNDARWERKYQALVRFRDEAGHCNVPRSKCESLCAWVKEQRQAYKINGGTLRGNRAARLEIIEFVWRVEKGKEGEKEEERKEKATKLGRGGSNDAKQLINDARWERNYQELIKFRDEAGHCQVPRSHKFKTLCYWVDNQRQAYKLNGGTLRGNRAARLESLEFVWRVEKGKEGEKEEEGKEKATKNSLGGASEDLELLTIDERWERRYRELIKFRDETGHFCLPRNQQFKTLCTWVHNQRSQYQRNGGTLMGNRVARLESIGFLLRAGRGRQRDVAARQAVCRRGVTGSDSGGNMGSATGNARKEGREVTTSPAPSEGTEAHDKSEVLSTVHCVLNNPSFGAHDIESFKRDVQELAENLARKKGGAQAPGASTTLTCADISDAVAAKMPATPSPLTASLSVRPRTLHDLWAEWQFGGAGRKPAKDFNSSERGAVKNRYCFRKTLWDKVAEMVRAGETAHVACDKIHAAYGESLSATAVLRKMQAGRRSGV